MSLLPFVVLILSSPWLVWGIGPEKFTYKNFTPISVKSFLNFPSGGKVSFNNPALSSSQIELPSQNSIFAYYDGTAKAISIVFGVRVTKNQNGEVSSIDNVGVRYYDLSNTGLASPGNDVDGKPPLEGFQSIIEVKPTIQVPAGCVCGSVFLYQGTLTGDQTVFNGVKYDPCCFSDTQAAGSISKSIDLIYTVTFGSRSTYSDGTAKPYISASKKFTLNLNVYNTAITTSLSKASAIKAQYTVGVSSSSETDGAIVYPVYSIKICGTAQGYILNGLENTRLSFKGGASVVAPAGNGISIGLSDGCQVFRMTKKSWSFNKCDTAGSSLDTQGNACDICQVTSFGFQGVWAPQATGVVSLTDTLSHTIGITDIGGNSNSQCWTQISLTEQVFALQFANAQVETTTAGSTTSFTDISTSAFAIPGAKIRFPVNVVSSSFTGLQNTLDMLPNTFKYYATSVSIGYKAATINPAAGATGQNDVKVLKKIDGTSAVSSTALALRPNDNGGSPPTPGLYIQLTLCQGGPDGKAITKNGATFLGCFDWTATQQGEVNNAIKTFVIPITATFSFSDINGVRRKRRAGVASDLTSSSSIAANFTILFNPNGTSSTVINPPTATNIKTSDARTKLSYFSGLFAALLTLFFI
ncbi:hypothetical protein BDR26DRAFT_869319 [Obelidium mucronatum]|nr:hypothetical protein BDR26DRAFT_869319 [Obelidium mucronatum]